MIFVAPNVPMYLVGASHPHKIDAQRREYPLPDMCEVLAVSISGYRV